MTRSEIVALRPGDSLIGVMPDDELPVVDVTRAAGHTFAHVRVGAAVYPVEVKEGGPEIRGVAA